MLENTEKQPLMFNFCRENKSLCARLGKLNIMHVFYWMQLITYVIDIGLSFLFLFQKKEWPLLFMKLTLSPMHSLYRVDDINIVRYLNPTCKLTQPQVPP